RRKRSAASARHLPAAQELEELDTFAQPTAQHLRALDHLGDERRDLFSAKIESLVEGLERLEDLSVREVRIVQWRELHPALVDQLGVADVEPAVLDRLTVQIGAGIGGRERDLDRVGVDLRGKADRFFDRLLCFAGKSKNEGSVDRDSELVTI